MGKHLPPPKNKHLSKKENEHAARKEARAGARDRELMGERQFGLKPLISCGISAALLLALHFVPSEGWLRLILYILPFSAASAGVIMRLSQKLKDGDFYEEDILMLLASLTAFCIGHYPAASIVMILYRIGESFTDYAISNCRTYLDSFISHTVRKANILKNGRVYSVKPEKVKLGDILIVSPGELIPLDGEVVEGTSTLDTSLISGEAMQIKAAPGSYVLSGSRNTGRDLKIRVSRSCDKSAFNTVADNLMDSGRRKAGYELFVSRYVGVYSFAAVLAALLLALVPSIMYGEWRVWIERAIPILIIACPCAFTVSVPLAFLCGLIKSALSGIHVKNDFVLESLADTETMVFDKTGTITDGRYSVVGVYPEGVSEKELIRAAAEAERFSKHPVARAIRQLMPLRELEENENPEIEELHGKGISAFVKGHHIYVGNASLLDEHDIRYNVPYRSGAAIHVSVDGIYWGYILVSDKVKSGAFDSLEAMRRQGVRNMVLLTGDVRSISRTLASSLNFDMVKAELVPESKVSAVEYLMATKGERSRLGFVGDAENDREALSRADVGIALGARNSQEPFNTADTVILSENLTKLPLMLKIARLSAGAARLNIIVLAIEKLTVLILSFFGLMPILLAAVLETGAIIFTMLNSMRVLKYNEEDEI